MTMILHNPAEFRHRIEVIYYEQGRDEDNVPIEEWKTRFKTRAQVHNLTGKQDFDTVSTTNREIIKCTIRYRKGWVSCEPYKDKLIFDGREFDIVYANVVENLKRYIEIRAERVVYG